MKKNSKNVGASMVCITIYPKLSSVLFPFCLGFSLIFLKLLTIILKVTEVTTKQQKLTKVSKNSKKKSSLFAQRAKNPRPKALHWN